MGARILSHEHAGPLCDYEDQTLMRLSDGRNVAARQAVRRERTLHSD